MYIWSSSHSDPELRKPLEFPVMRAIKLSLFMLMRQLWEAPEDGGWLPQEPAWWLEHWDFWSPPWFPGREEGLEAESMVSVHWFHQTCLCDEAARKTQRMGLGELPGWWTRSGSGRVRPWRKHGNCIPFLHHAPRYLFHLDVTELQLFKINQLCSK